MKPAARKFADKQGFAEGRSAETQPGKVERARENGRGVFAML